MIALSGDGSAMYTLQALWTMAREKLDVVAIIFKVVARRAITIVANVVVRRVVIVVVSVVSRRCSKGTTSPANRAKISLRVLFHG